MKKIISFIFIILASFHNTCFAQTIQTNDIKVIEKTLASIDQDTLVIFDIDDVLIAPKDQILQTQNKKHLEKLNQKLEESVGKKNADIFYSIIFTQRDNGPVDIKMKDIISHLQSKGIKALALTNCFTGRFGKIESMEDWRYNELKKHGYHFELSWQELQPKTFTELAKNSPMPVFKNGIVFTSAASKGEALKEFLQHAGITPHKIIFIDDKIKHLESVAEIAKSYNIQYIGIEYTAARDISASPLNKKRADVQYEVLEKEKKWISDSEADALLIN
ncbi:MAG: hypothetical protein RLZZ59_487 [Pseudomonadota bacterium]|jgi:FMN phosphatase YigB (HAD superfamily)